MNNFNLLLFAKIAKKRNPKLWEKAKARARAKMGKKHSARLMQLATKYYKQMGGTYSGRKTKSNSLKKWSKEDWGYSSERSKGKGRYRPKKVWNKMTKEEKESLNRSKRRGTKKGKQFMPIPKKLRKKANNFNERIEKLIRFVKRIDQFTPEEQQSLTNRYGNITPIEGAVGGMSQVHLAQLSPNNPKKALKLTDIDNPLLQEQYDKSWDRYRKILKSIIEKKLPRGIVPPTTRVKLNGKHIGLVQDYDPNAELMSKIMSQNSKARPTLQKILERWTENNSKFLQDVNESIDSDSYSNVSITPQQVQLASLIDRFNQRTLSKKGIAKLNKLLSQIPRLGDTIPTAKGSKNSPVLTHFDW